MNFIPITNLFIAIIRESTKNFHAKRCWYWMTLVLEFRYFYTEIVNFGWNAFTNFGKVKVFLEWYYLSYWFEMYVLCTQSVEENVWGLCGSHTQKRRSIIHTLTTTTTKTHNIAIGQIFKVFFCSCPFDEYTSAGSHDKIRHL